MIDRDHFLYLVAFTLGLAASAIAGLILARRAVGRPHLERVALGFVPASAFVLATSALLICLKTPENYWNACRLAPSVGLLYGEKLYRGPSSGPVLNTIYPPMSYVAYVPAGIFSRPSAAIRAGSCVSMAFVYLPFVALCFAGRRGEGSGRHLLSWYVFAGFCTLAMTSGTLISPAHWVHSDAPAIGFAGLACLFLYLSSEASRFSVGAAVASCLCASLSVWSKQTMAPLLVVLPLWVAMSRGAAAFVRYAVVLLVSFGAISLAFRGVFGLGSLAFNILKVPSRHPWNYQGDAAPMGLAYLALELSYECLPVLILIALALGYGGIGPDRQARRAGDESSGDRARGWLGENPWILFALAAIAQVPMSLLGKVKIGGAINSDAPPHYLLCFALAAIVFDRLSTGRKAVESRSGALSLVVLASFLSPFTLINQRILSDLRTLRPVASFGDEQAYEFARAHPGEAYFPWNPLSSLLAEGRLYHFEYGMIDRNQGGYPLGPEHFRSHLPPKMRLVCFPPDRQSEWTMKLLGEFSKRVEVPELPGWICYAR